MTRRRFLVVLLLAALVYSAPEWMQEEDAESGSAALLDRARELRAASDATSQRKAEALQRVLKEAERQRESLSPEQLAMIEELRSARGAVRREHALENLLHVLEEGRRETRSFYGWAAESWASARRAYADIQPRAQWSLWIATLAVVGASVVAALRSRVTFARLVATFGFRVSRGWLVVLSFVAIALAMATRTNPWKGFPAELVLPPLIALIGCALALRVVDFNYPVWNSLVRGCGAPLISMAFIATYLRLIQL